LFPTYGHLWLADGAANPYLLPATVLAAGLDGIANKRDPGKRLDINMYTDGDKAKNAKKLPLNLLDALRALEKSSVFKAALASRWSRPTSSSSRPTGTTIVAISPIGSGRRRSTASDVVGLKPAAQPSGGQLGCRGQVSLGVNVDDSHSAVLDLCNSFSENI